MRGGKDLHFPAFFPERVLEPLSYQETGGKRPRHGSPELRAGVLSGRRRWKPKLRLQTESSRRPRLTLRLQAENKGRQAPMIGKTGLKRKQPDRRLHTGPFGDSMESCRPPHTEGKAVKRIKQKKLC